MREREALAADDEAEVKNHVGKIRTLNTKERGNIFL